MKPKKKIVEKKPTPFEIRAEEIAKQLATNARARNLLSRENDSLVEELKELIEFRSVQRELTTTIEHIDKEGRHSETFKIRLVDRKETVQNGIAIARALISPTLRKYYPDDEQIKNNNLTHKVATKMALILTEYLRKDGFLARKLLDNRRWAKKYIQEDGIKPYIAIIDEHGGYI